MQQVDVNVKAAASIMRIMFMGKEFNILKISQAMVMIHYRF
jgi:hypothetical protein